MRQLLAVLGIAACLLAISGCSLVVSEEREIERLTNNFVARVNASQWDEAKAMLYADDFIWIQVDAAGNPTQHADDAGWTAWVERIKTLPDRSAVDFEQLRTQKINDRKYIIEIRLQVRQTTANKSSNTFWPCQLAWEEQNGRWQIVTIKDRAVPEKVIGN